MPERDEIHRVSGWGSEPDERLVDQRAITRDEPRAGYSFADCTGDACGLPSARCKHDDIRRAVLEHIRKDVIVLIAGHAWRASLHRTHRHSDRQVDTPSPQRGLAA